MGIAEIQEGFIVRVTHGICLKNRGGRDIRDTHENRGVERKKKRRKRKQTDQQGIFLATTISECSSNDESGPFALTLALADSEGLCEKCTASSSDQAGAAVPTIQPLAALTPVTVPSSTAELKGHAPNMLTQASAVLESA